MKELKPCPFCGGAANINRADRAVECSACTAMTFAQDDVELAVKQWNRRAVDLEELAGAVEEFCGRYLSDSVHRANLIADFIRNWRKP